MLSAPQTEAEATGRSILVAGVKGMPQALGLNSSVCLLSFDDTDEPDNVFADSMVGLREVQIQGRPAGSNDCSVTSPGVR
ncbi:hypothetical protein ALI144C_41205 [Actinosynnema sp. ALI-1.44]|nr:hypothetical protein ALI144C_41205 [Actinosynnema sp. ALI-1.44]